MVVVVTVVVVVMVVVVVEMFRLGKQLENLSLYVTHTPLLLLPLFFPLSLSPVKRTASGQD